MNLRNVHRHLLRLNSRSRNYGDFGKTYSVVSGPFSSPTESRLNVLKQVQVHELTKLNSADLLSRLRRPK
jgi:hypothetical protein